MMGFGLVENSDASVVHRGWHERWAPDIKDQSLRETILANPAIRSKVGKAICEHSQTKNDQNDLILDDVLDEVRSFGSPEGLRSLGIAWLAPRLVICLFDKAIRSACGPLSPDDIHDIIHFRDHVEIEAIAELPNENGLIDEGRKCLISWLKGRSSIAARMCLLQVAPEELETFHNATHRAELFGRFAELKRTKSHG